MSSLLTLYGLYYHIPSMLPFSYLEYHVTFIDPLRATVTYNLPILGLQHHVSLILIIRN